ncbi:DUF3181 family protein [Richelia intracellularis]|uniref:DUF3181 family protein n=1 Tax=Richelia intracellularis TaxID=1164990 RepID=UPI0005C755A2|nr:DUF3181 family protein [Richelia intracellularis]
MVSTNTNKIIEALAFEIGDNLYMDIAKWHLYLSNAKLHTVVAEKMYPLLVDNTITEDRIFEVLSSIPVKIGGGKKELPLTDLLTLQSQMHLVNIMRTFQQEI